MIRLIFLFLVAMAVLALFGRFRTGRGAPKRLAAAKCPSCGRPLIGKAPCPCRTAS